MSLLSLSGASIQPPIAPPENNGQRLLNLVRSLEKNDDENLLEVIESFQQWIALIARRGVLGGDTEMADKVLQRVTSKNNSKGYQSNKRAKKKNNGQQNDLTIHVDDNPLSATSSETLDAQLILSAPLRILQTRADYFGKIQLVALSCELIQTMSEFIKDRSSSLSGCILAEYELLAQSGKAILAGIETTVRDILSSIDDLRSGLQLETSHALQACFKCASSLIGLFGTKLSRSGQLLSNLAELAWETVTMENVNEAAALVIATLPFAGSANKQAPAELWNRSVSDALGSIALVLKAVAPFAKSILSLNDSVSDKTRDHLRKHIQALSERKSEDQKLHIFLQLLKGMTEQFLFLFMRPALAPMAAMQLTECKVNLVVAFQIMDVLIGFSSTAESKYFGTKKRLRHETVENGLLSYHTLAVAASNHVKLYGLRMLSTLIDSAGRSLLPHARRIHSLLLHSILSSSSLSLREIIDTASAFQSKRKLWLNTSLKTRQACIDTFKSAILSLGYDSQPSSDHGASSMISMSACDRAMVAVAGILVEQITASSRGDQWGTEDEVEELIISCCDCMAASLSSDGSFLTIGVRECFDSVALRCLESLSRFSSRVRAAFLGLAIACASTPWQDGTSSLIRAKLCEVALICSQEEDTFVCLTARSALTLCEALANPRVPAITFVTKPAESHSNLLFDSMASQLSEVGSNISKETKRQKESSDNGQCKKPKTEQKDLIKNEPVGEERKHEPPVQPSPPSLDTQLESKAKDHYTNSMQLEGQEKPQPKIEKVTESASSEVKIEEHPESEDEFPDIVDCAPDEEDKEEEE